MKPFCKDCEYNVIERSEMRCRAMVDIIRGIPTPCEIARSSGNQPEFDLHEIVADVPRKMAHPTIPGHTVAIATCTPYGAWFKARGK